MRIFFFSPLRQPGYLSLWERPCGFAPPPHGGFAFIGHANLNHQLPMIAEPDPSTTSFKACCISLKVLSNNFPQPPSAHTGVVFALSACSLNFRSGHFPLLRLRPPSGPVSPVPVPQRSGAGSGLRRLLSGSRG